MGKTEYSQVEVEAAHNIYWYFQPMATIKWFFSKVEKASISCFGPISLYIFFFLFFFFFQLSLSFHPH